MRCATHPDVETGLTCSKCGKPICPECMVQTPVGARCPQCARLKKLPTFVLGRRDYVMAIVVGLCAGIAGGILWYFIPLFIPFVGIFNLLIAGGIGYGIGRAVSHSVNRKRGTFLKIVAAVSILIAFIIGNQMMSPGHFLLGFNLFDILAIVIGVSAAVTQL